jgi:hypothetical protein
MHKNSPIFSAVVKKILSKVVAVTFIASYSEAQNIQPYSVVKILASEMDMIKSSSDYCTWQSTENYKNWGGKTSGKIFYGTYAFTLSTEPEYARRDVDRTLTRFSMQPLDAWDKIYGFERVYSAKETPDYTYQINIYERSTDNQYITHSSVCFSVFGYKAASSNSLYGFAILNDGPVKFRESPSTNGKILFSLAKGALVKLRGACGDNWCPVSYDSINGHMMKKYLDRY